MRRILFVFSLVGAEISGLPWTIAMSLGSFLGVWDRYELRWLGGENSTFPFITLNVLWYNNYTYVRWFIFQIWMFSPIMTRQKHQMQQVNIFNYPLLGAIRNVVVDNSNNDRMSHGSLHFFWRAVTLEQTCVWATNTFLIFLLIKYFLLVTYITIGWSFSFMSNNLQIDSCRFKF